MPAPRRDTPLANSLLAPTGKPLPRLFPTPTDDLSLLHAKLYNFIALILRAHINQWYTRISPNDQALLPTINDLLHRVLPPLLELDSELISTLLLTDLPVILTTHIRTYWDARAAIQITPGALDKAYHARLPLQSVSLQPIAAPVAVPMALAEALAAPLSDKPALAEEVYALSPEYLTALTDTLLALHLPPADFESDAERLIIQEVLARAVLANIGRKLSAPWFWAQVGIKLLPPPKPRDIRATLYRAYSVLIVAVSFLWTTCRGLFHTRPARGRVADPWLILLRTLVETPGPTPIYVSLLLLLFESLCLLLSPVIDRLFPVLMDTLISPTTAIKLLDLGERILFPNGWPEQTIDPTPEEAVQLDMEVRQRVRERGLSDHLLDPLSHAGCNSHLVGMIYDSVVRAVVPTLKAT